MSETKSNRIYALDALRGLTVAAMIVVNNSGGGPSFTQLEHSAWNGLTFCDMVFPSFLFIVGLTAYISLSKMNFRPSRQLILKIFRRAALIMLIGWAIHYFENVLHGDWGLAGLRLTGVLPRIAVCYFVVSLSALVFNRRTILFITAGLLVLYSIILIAGNGYLNDTTNLLGQIDRAILGKAHLYSKQPVDPEGLVGCLSSIAHTMIGFCFGSIVLNRSESLECRLLKVIVVGFLLYLAGLALSCSLPLNKRIWSPSYVLVTCGLVAMMLSTISYATDVCGVRKPFRIFDIFGVNPLFLYVFAEVMAPVLSALKLRQGYHGWLVSVIPDPCFASLVYALTILLVVLAVGYPLYKKKIYIKL